jgi:hypothetical protein
MEQQNKYYTPELEELFLGYSFELLTLDGWKSGTFPHLLSENKELNQYGKDEFLKLSHAVIRTKYLDQSDIESLGWTHVGGQLVSHGRQDYEKPGMMLKHFPRHNSLFIAKAINPDALDGFAEKLFDGECKSINELRKIMNWLNIK